MNALFQPPLVEAATAIDLMGSALVALGRRAFAAGRDPVLAVSPAVPMREFGQAVEGALARLEPLRTRLHLFAAYLAIDAGDTQRDGLACLRSRLGLHPRQLHLPSEGSELFRAARAFEADIRTFFRLSPESTPAFDALCLAPEDLVAHRHADASDRLATGAYHLATGRLSVALTIASLADASAVLSFGPEQGLRASTNLPSALAARVERLHWIRHAADPSNSHEERSQ